MAAPKYSAIQLDDSEEDEELIVSDTVLLKQELPKAGDDLQFHEYTEVALLPNAEGKEKSKAEKTNDDIKIPTRTTLLGDESSDDENDKTELLAGQKKQPSFWTFEYYQKFFDVDTKQVLNRILYSMLPTYGRNFLTTKVRPDPDLYGPFWVCATLVFTIAISGNLASYFASEGGTQWVYNFHKVTFAAFVIYGYAWLVPSAVWGFLLWRGNQAGFLFLEIVCVYGYSLSIFIPISILWVLPQDWLRWTLMIVGVILSGSVLCLTFFRAVEDDDRKVQACTLVVILLLHCAVAIGFKLYFFKTRAVAVKQIVNEIRTTTRAFTTSSRYV
ncbi:protein YIPF1-like [Rhopilema esculentum]|uniref:protein YIPF1-like n=1 Tax=Rhopilema esculentum TaxID=499914 RepID=UPI0031DA3AE0